MTAAHARRLKVGDWVIATFGGRGVRKKCEIIAIAWPTFTLRTKDYRGDEMITGRNIDCLGPFWENCAPGPLREPCKFSCVLTRHS
jgi:hypothetical protein